MKTPLFILFIVLSCVLFAQDETADVHTYGGDSFDEGRQIIQVNDGGYFVIGTTGSIFNNTEIILTKLNSDLECEWSQHYGTPGVDKGTSICKADGDNVVICAYGNEPEEGDYNIRLIKVDAFGGVIWQNVIGNSDWDFGYKIISSGDGFLVAGTSYGNGNFGSDATLWFLNAEGELMSTWIMDQGGNEKWNDVDQMEDGSIITTGGDGNSMLIRKWNAEGGEEWTYTKSINGQIVVGIGADIGENGIFFSGIEEADGLERGVRGMINLEGVESFFQELNLADDFYMGEPVIYNQSVAFPGMTRNYGAGGADACIYMFNTNNGFIGAPTFGGAQDETMYSGIVNDIGEIISVGSYTSFSEGVEQIAVIRLSAFYNGDYIKTFDYSGDCVSYLSIYDEPVNPNSGQILETVYYDCLGHLLDEQEVRNKNYSGLLLQIDKYSNGDMVVRKVLFQ